MSFTFGKRSTQGSNSSSIKVGDGVFVNKATIAEAGSEYDCSMFEGSEYKDDLALRMKLDQEGLTFQKDLYIGGKFKWESDQRVGLGSLFKVENVFVVLGIDGDINDEGHLDIEAIKALPGREIFFLQYSVNLKDTGKPRYRDYQIIDARMGEESDEAVAARIYSRFNKEIEKGYMKAYTPASVLKEQAEAAMAFDAPAANGVSSTEDPFADTFGS